MNERIHEKAAAEMDTPVLEAALAEYDSDPRLRATSRLYPFLLAELKKRRDAERSK